MFFYINLATANPLLLPLASNVSKEERQFIHGYSGPSTSYSPLRHLLIIPDLHADFQAFTNILQERGIIVDSNENFAINSESKLVREGLDLVILGDMTGGNGNSKALINLIMELQNNAPESLRVHPLLGNHELYAITSPKFRGEIKYYGGTNEVEHRQAYEREFKSGAIGRWLRTLNSVVMFEGTHTHYVYAHAGVGEWMLAENSPSQTTERVNQTIRWLIDYYQSETDAQKTKRMALKRLKIPGTTKPYFGKRKALKIVEELEYWVKKMGPLHTDFLLQNIKKSPNKNAVAFLTKLSRYYQKKIKVGLGHKIHHGNAEINLPGIATVSAMDRGIALLKWLGTRRSKQEIKKLKQSMVKDQQRIKQVEALINQHSKKVHQLEQAITQLEESQPKKNATKIEELSNELARKKRKLSNRQTELLSLQSTLLEARHGIEAMSQGGTQTLDINLVDTKTGTSIKIVYDRTPEGLVAVDCGAVRNSFRSASK